MTEKGNQNTANERQKPAGSDVPVTVKKNKSMLKRKTLDQLYATHTGKVSDKWSSYLTEYERFFSEYRDKPVRLLEIGVQNGGSLEIWSQYFTNARKFIGCDIDPACAQLRYDDPRIAVVIGDANSDAAQDAILEQSKEFDTVR